MKRNYDNNIDEDHDDEEDEDVELICPDEDDDEEELSTPDKTGKKEFDEALVPPTLLHFEIVLEAYGIQHWCY